MPSEASSRAGIVAVAAYALFAWPTAGWFDGGELVASAWGLGISHPPGHPLWATTAALLARLPLGPIPLRIALASAVAMGIAVGFVVETVRVAGEPVGASPEARDRWGTFAGALFAVSALAVGQAIRPEVYALAAAGVAGTAWATVRFVVTRDARALALAGLLTGLGGANHHLLALLFVPSVAVAAWTELDDPLRARRGTLAGLAIGAVALLAYAYLPLRAAALPSIAAPRTIGEIAEVVSARVYQKAALGDAPGGLGHRLADVGAMVVLGTGGLFALLSLGGLWVAARVAPIRRLAPILAIPIVLYPLVRAWLGFTSGNPDAQGYVLPAVASMAVAVGVLFVVGHALAMSSTGPGRGAVAAFVVLGALAIGLAASETFARDADPEPGPEVYTDAIFDDVPARAQLLLTSFEVHFALLGRATAESPRPDVELLGLPFVGYPGTAREATMRDPALRPLLRAWLLEGEVPEAEIAALAAERPVLLEIDPHVGPAIRPYLTPVGPLAIVHGEPRSLADLVATADDHFTRWDAIEARLADDAARGETTKIFGWRHFQDAILYAARGERSAAEKSLALAARHAPHAREIERLRRAVSRATGPIDVEPLQIRD